MRVVVIAGKEQIRRLMKKAAVGVMALSACAAALYVMSQLGVSVPTVSEQPLVHKGPVYQERTRPTAFDRTMDQFVLKVQDFYYEERE